MTYDLSVSSDLIKLADQVRAFIDEEVIPREGALAGRPTASGMTCVASCRTSRVFAESSPLPRRSSLAGSGSTIGPSR